MDEENLSPELRRAIRLMFESAKGWQPMPTVEAAGLLVEMAQKFRDNPAEPLDNQTGPFYARLATEPYLVEAFEILVRYLPNQMVEPPASLLERFAKIRGRIVAKTKEGGP